jgi:hypothetical protein
MPPRARRLQEGRYFLDGYGLKERQRLREQQLGSHQTRSGSIRLVAVLQLCSDVEAESGGEVDEAAQGVGRAVGVACEGGVQQFAVLVGQGGVGGCGVGGGVGV